MEYRNLGNSGLEVSRLSYGTWVTFGQQLTAVNDCAQLLDTAYSNGINFFDTAEIYSHGKAEELLGQALRKLCWNRSDYVISTKIFWGGQGPNRKGVSRKRIVEGLSASLDRMGLEYTDVLFCHRPDYDTPVEETVRAMNHVINQGKVLYWGTSEWSAERIREAVMTAEKLNLIAPIVEQPKYNLFYREKMEVEYLQLFKDYSYGTTIWSPLEYGVLTGKHNKGIAPDTRLSMPEYDWLKARVESEEGSEKISKAEKLATIAEKLKISLAQLSIAWCLKNQNVSTVLLGAKTENQLIENIESESIASKLNTDIMSEIESVLQNTPVQPINEKSRN